MNTTQKKTILLVEDEIIIALASAQTIKSLGYEVLVAHSGEDAIQIVSSNPNINIVLMDIDLGSGIDGTKATEIILQIKEIPVVFLSSRTEPAILERTESVTSYGYIVKGSSLTVLKASLTMACKLFETNHQLRITKNKLEATLNALPDLLLEVDEETYCFDFHTPKPNHFFNYTNGRQENIIGKKLIDVLPSQAAETMRLSLEEAKQKGYSHGKQFGLTISGEDSYFELSVSKKINNETDERFIILSRDITERKKVELALKESEGRLLQAMNIAQLGIWDWDIETDKTVWQGKMFNIYGIPKEEFTGKGSDYISLTREDYRKDQLENISAAFKNGVTPDDLREGKNIQIRPKELCIVRPDGSEVFTIGDAVTIVDEKGNPKKMLGITMDITERKLSQEILLENEELLSITLHSIGDAVIATNVTGQITRMNETAERLTGWTFVEAKGKNLPDVFHIINAESRQKVENPVDKVIETGKIIGLANHTVLISKDGKEYQISDSAAPIRDKQGNIKGVVLVFSDITEQYKAAENIRKNEARFRNIIEASPVPFALNDENRNITYLNSAFTNTFGYTIDEISTLEDWWPKAYPDKVYREWVMATWQIHLEEAKKIGRTFEPIELNIVCKNGNIKTVIASAVSLDAKFEDEHLVVLYDITERKMGEIKLKENQMLYESLVDVLPHNLYRIDLEGRLTFVNKTLLKNLNIPLDELIGKISYSFYPQELALKYQTDDQNIIKTGETLFLIENNILPAKGVVSIVEVIKTPILDAHGNICGIQGVFWDVTEKRKAEDEIKSLLAEKELILKEVHHRIKNNMATILGFLTLQADASKEPSAAIALKDAESRVQTMMILYDKLYNSSNYSDISIKEYLTTLIDQIVLNFPNANSVKIEKDLEDFVIDSKRSSAIGIILNELITNTMKYAFDDKTKGLIKISTQVKEGIATLIIADNGKGLPESINIENSTGFGLILVGMLARQLNGKIKFENENGTKIVLEFKI